MSAMNECVRIGCLLMAAGALVVGCASGGGSAGATTDPARLRGVTWNLTEMNGVPQSGGVTIEFSADNRIAGAAPVNRYFGGIDKGPDATGQLAFKGIGATLMAGVPEAMQREREFFDTMQRVDSFRLPAEGNLDLISRDKAVLRFQKAR